MKLCSSLETACFQYNLVPDTRVSIFCRYAQGFDPVRRPGFSQVWGYGFRVSTATVVLIYFSCEQLCRMIRCLVVCLVGIPGAGKSHFARDLAQFSDRKTQIIVFDDFKTRDEALAAAKAVISDGWCDVVIDDNNYYKSMRKEIYRMARDAGAGYVQVLIDPPLELCLQRNGEREDPARVPEEIVRRMHSRLERPSNSGWDQGFVASGAETMDTLRAKSWVPTKPAAIATRAEEKAVLLDVELRREISRQVTAARPEERAELAAKLNNDRKERLKHKK
jgi:predicted kinase